jgi:quercetin dioxygenase-like cupin family protein
VDVRSIEAVPRVMFGDLVPVWRLAETDELKRTIGLGTLDLVIEFELVDGKTTDAHRHPTHEFYYILSGRGTMSVEHEDRPVHAGDFIWVKPNELHQLRQACASAPLRCFTFVVRCPGEDGKPVTDQGGT